MEPLAMDRMVADCIGQASEVIDGIRYRWPLELRLADDARTILAENLAASEIVGHYARVSKTLRIEENERVYAGAVLPVIAYDEERDTFKLLLEQNDDRLTMATGVPRSVLALVPRMKWHGPVFRDPRKLRLCANLVMLNRSLLSTAVVQMALGAIGFAIDQWAWEPFAGLAAIAWGVAVYLESRIQKLKRGLFDA